MRNWKRTSLSLAITGVIYGTAFTSVHATDLIKNEEGITVSAISDNVINVNHRQTSDTDGGANKAALTIDVTDTTAPSVALEADININAEIDGTVNDGGTDLDAAQAKGLVITDSATDPDLADDTLKGDININAKIKGGTYGLQVDVAVAGDVTIAKDVEISGDNALVLKAVTGNFNNKGTITSAAAAADGAALTLDGAVTNGPGDSSEPIHNEGVISNTNQADGVALKILTGATADGPIKNTGTISGKTAIDAAESFGLNNTGGIDGAITVASSKTGTINNTGTITGDISGGTIDITNESGGLITSGTMSINTLTNDANSTVNAATLTAAGIVSNDYKLNVSSAFSATAGLVTNSGDLTVGVFGDDGEAGTIDADAGFTNDAGGVVSVNGLFDVSGAKLTNNGTVTANSLTATAGFDNGDSDNASATMTVNGALTIGAHSTNAGSVTAESFTAGAFDFANTGTADLGTYSGDGAVSNTGSLTLKQGSSSGAYSQTGGTLTLSVTDGASAVYNTASASFGSSSTVKVKIADSAMTTTGVLNSGGGGVVTLINGDITNPDNLSVSVDNAFVSLSSIDKSSGLKAVVTVLDAGDVIKDQGFGTSTQALARKLQQQGDLTNGALSKVTSAYGTLSDNSGSPDRLKQYFDNIRPDDSGSSAHTAADAVNGAQNTISDRGVYTRSGVNTGGMVAQGSFWMQALVSKSKQKNREGSLAYNGDMVGYTIGADSEWGNNTTGLAFTYGASEVTFERDQKDEVKSYIGSVYNIWQRNNWYLDGSLSFGKSKHEGSRMKEAAALGSEYDSMQFGGMGTLGTYIPVQKMVFEPMLGLRMSHVNVDSYTAKNSDGSLTETVGKTTYKKAEGGLGAAFSTVATIGNTTYQPRVAFMYYRDFVGDKIDQQVNFAGQDYTIQGASAEKNTYELKVGLNAWNDSKMEVNLGYTRVMQKNFSSDNFKFKFKYNF